MKAQYFASLCTIILLLVGCAHSKFFQDTTDGISYFIVFDTPILYQYVRTNLAIDSKPYNLVWGAAPSLLPMYASTNPNLIRTYYMPFHRDVDATHTLAYWKAFHPDWVLYTCDRVTPAYMPGETGMPLDIGNPEVIDWQLTNYLQTVRQFGYDGIAADNFAIGNAIGACGTYAKNGTWIQKYTGNWVDAKYNADSMNWVANFSRKLKESAPDLVFGINFSLNEMQANDTRVTTVMASVDYVLDEAGFTQWGSGPPTMERWIQIATWVENMQAANKHYFGIHELEVVTRAGKEWAMASYLMCKNAQSSVVIVAIQDYGHTTQMIEYDNLNIGSAVEKRWFSNGVFVRRFTNGYVIVNPSTTNAYYTFPWNSPVYTDVMGNTYTPNMQILVPAQTGLVLGVKPASVPTIAPTPSPTIKPTSPPPPPVQATTRPLPTPAPTPAPTPRPTPAPTPRPTPAPTAFPGSGSQVVCVGPIFENVPVTIACPNPNHKIMSVMYANYGLTLGTCGNFVKGSCIGGSSTAVVVDKCVGRNTCTFPVANNVFGDPCPKTGKSFYTQVLCS